MNSVEFLIPGQPVGKGRPRFTRAGRTYTPEKTRGYEQLVKLEYIRQCSSFRFEPESSLALYVAANYKIPKNVSRSRAAQMAGGSVLPTIKPDGDNILKIIADALQHLAFEDDKAIVSWHLEKHYAEEPSVRVMLKEVSG